MQHGWAHRKWNWADEQGFIQEFVLPFSEQYGWTKQGSVLQKGASGKFDDYGVHHPSVVFRSPYYYLFYTGYGVGVAYNGIGVARSTSPTGTYTRLNNGDAIVPRGTLNALGVPSVIYDDYETDANKKWKMWMTGQPTAGATWRVYYSYSANPDSGWSTPVQVYAHATDSIAAVGCLRLGNLYYLGVKRGANIELLTTKDPTGTYTLRHVLLTVSASGWDSSSVDYFSLIYILGVFYLFYSGTDGTNYRIGVAFESYGGMTGSAFSKYIMNPVLDKGAAGQPDATHAFKPFIMQVENKFYMWYTGVNPTDRQIMVATIP